MFITEILLCVVVGLVAFTALTGTVGLFVKE